MKIFRAERRYSIQYRVLIGDILEEYNTVRVTAVTRQASMVSLLLELHYMSDFRLAQL